MADIDIQHLVQITNVGIKTANFVEIKAAIIDWYKSIYGSDIDLSTGSADGVFVNDLALILNNILEVVAFTNRSLNVDEASGIYLDRLCKLSNVTRRQATYSSTTLEVTNNATSDYLIQPNETLEFLDKASIVWQYTNNSGDIVRLKAGTKMIFAVTCEEIGPIEAKAGWIDRTVELLNFTVNQPKDATMGRSVETDVELRSRRLQSLGYLGTTVVESLISSLLNIAGIVDVKIYNNNSGEEQTSADNTTIEPHSIYVIIRYDENIDIASLDSNIGNTIYNKLTPGIQTSKTGTEYGRTYEFVPEQLGTSIQLFHQDVYWKQSQGQHPEISITLNIEKYFTQDEVFTIGNILIEYLNNLQVGTDLSAQKLTVQTLNADPRFRGLLTYTVGAISIGGAAGYVSRDGHYDYNNVDYTVVDAGSLGSTVTFKLNYKES